MTPSVQAYIWIFTDRWVPGEVPSGRCLKNISSVLMQSFMPDQHLLPGLAEPCRRRSQRESTTLAVDTS
jgi:hypothetical protein